MIHSLLDRIQRNCMWKAVGEGSKLLLALFFLCLARQYGPEKFGVFSIFYAMTLFFSVLADLGLNILTTRQIAAYKNDVTNTLRSFFSLKLVALPLWLFAVLLFYTLGHKQEYSLTLLVLLTLAQAARNLMEFFCSVFSGLEWMSYESWLKFLSHISVLALGLVGFLQDLSIVWAGAALFGGYLLGAIVAGFLCHGKWGLFPINFYPEKLKLLYTESLPLIVMTAALSTLTRWDVLFLGLLGVPTIHIGWYGASEKIISALGILPAMVSMAAYPVLSDLNQNDLRNFSPLHNKLLRFFLLAGLGCAVLVLLASQPLIRGLYGDVYIGASIPLSILALGLVFTFPNYILLSSLVASCRSWDGAWTAGMACIANILLNLLLIPYLGIIGSAVASTLSQGVLFISGIVSLQKKSEANIPIQVPS